MLILPLVRRADAVLLAEVLDVGPNCRASRSATIW